MLLSGLKDLESFLKDFPGFESDEIALDEIVLAQIYLRNIYDLNGEEVPADVPLQRVWKASESESRMGEMQKRFKMETTISSHR